MIPSIEDILAMLLAGECTKEQAAAWINRHVEMASEGDGLRDHFAGLALSAMLSNPNKEGANCGRGGLETFPGYAYEWADSMLKARSA